ncbi:MAG TPA: hypothetical protein VNH38_04815 [Candidatus Dormibacteraeota bacterium]|nr:hypothetical protein [Candidatus Dormibacteraeota bacterium]
MVGPADDLAEMLSVVHGVGGQARRTEEAFTDVVAERSSRA